ncbi:hypothetical protein FOZ62_022018, partial [Perkinsus olseni]
LVRLLLIEEGRDLEDPATLTPSAKRSLLAKHFLTAARYIRRRLDIFLKTVLGIGAPPPLDLSGCSSTPPEDDDDDQDIITRTYCEFVDKYVICHRVKETEDPDLAALMR